MVLIISVLLYNVQFAIETVMFSVASSFYFKQSSSNLFQSQRSLKSQLNRQQSMLTIVFTGNREEAK